MTCMATVFLFPLLMVILLLDGWILCGYKGMSYESELSSISEKLQLSNGWMAELVKLNGDFLKPRYPTPQRGIYTLQQLVYT